MTKRNCPKCGAEMTVLPGEDEAHDVNECTKCGYKTVGSHQEPYYQAGDEAEMVEELKKRGYRVSRPPQPKPVEEFKPFKVLVDAEYGRGFPKERTVVREMRKTVLVKAGDVYGGLSVKKEDVFQFDPKIIEIIEGAEAETGKLDKQIKELRNQQEKIDDAAMAQIEKIRKPAYPPAKVER